VSGGCKCRPICVKQDLKIKSDVVSGCNVCSTCCLLNSTRLYIFCILFLTPKTPASYDLVSTQKYICSSLSILLLRKKYFQHVRGSNAHALHKFANAYSGFSVSRSTRLSHKRLCVVLAPLSDADFASLRHSVKCHVSVTAVMLRVYYCLRH